MNIYELMKYNNLELENLHKIGKDIYINILLPQEYKCSWTFNGKKESKTRYIGTLKDLYRLCNNDKNMLINVVWRYFSYQLTKDDIKGVCS